MTLDLEARKGKIGSSDIAAICGLNPYRSPLQVWAQMTNKAPPQEENDAMWLGSKLEQTVADFFSRKNPDYMVEKHQVTLIHPKIPFACATPDFVYSCDMESGILECKTTGSHNRKTWEEALPDYVHCQVMWQMGIANFDRTIVACLSDRELITHKVSYSKDVFSQLAEAAEKFMDMVKSDTPPEARGADKELLSRLHGPPDPDNTIELRDSETDVIVEGYLKLQAKKKELQEKVNVTEESLKDFQVRLLQKMKGAGIAYTNLGTIKYTETTMPEKVVKSFPMRRFTIKEMKHD